MKNTIKYLIMLVSLITLSGCGNSATVKEPRTIVLNIDSDVTPSFTSNFGSGSYNESTKKYIHNIDYIKDLYIFLSYDDLKTVTVHIPTSDMKEKTITKDVDFGQTLDAEVEITIEGVKTLDGLQILDNLNYSKLQIGKKNTFKFTLPTRDSDYNIKFTLPQYKEFNIKLTKDDLISGGAKIETIALAVDQIYIGFEGNYYEYKIYSQSTNSLVSSGDNYENQISTKYVVLPNIEGYYVKISSNNKKSTLHKVNVDENAVFNIGSSNTYSTGYVDVKGEDEHTYYEYKIYNKDTKTLQNDYMIYGSIDSYGLLVKNNQEDKWYYLSDLKNHIIKSEDDSWNNTYRVDFSKMIEVTFDITKIDYVTKEIISNQVKNDFYASYDLYAEFNENVFYLDIEEVKEGDVSIDLYSKDNQKIKTIENQIYSHFTGDIFSGTIEYNGRTIPYVFPVFVEDLVYNDGSYTYPDQIIDTDISMLSIKFVDDGNVQTLGSSDYIMDEEQEVIMGTQVGNSTYFELQVGSTYTFKYRNKNYTFTLSEADVDSGYVFIIDETIKKAQFRVPQDYYLIATNLDNMGFYPDSNGIVSIPDVDKGRVQVALSNGYATAWSKEIYVQEGTIYEFLPFYVVDGLEINMGDNYYSNKLESNNGVSYYSIDPFDDATIEYLTTNAYKINADGLGDYHQINLSEFEYNTEYNAYYYDFEENFDHIVEFEHESQTYELTWSNYYYKVSYYDYDKDIFVCKVYLMNDTTISYGYGDNRHEYTFTSHDNRNLKINLMYDGMNYQIIIESAN